MSKDGPSIGRWTLSVMVNVIMRYNPLLRQYYGGVKKQTGSGRLAHVAAMRKLTRMLYYMLKTREHWLWEDHDLTERKLSNLMG